MSGLIDGFLAGFQRTKRALGSAEHEMSDEVLEGIAAGSALGAGIGATLPFLLKRFSRVPSPLLNSQLTTRGGALAGGALGSFAGRWLPEVLRQGEKGYRTGAGFFPQKATETKRANETLQGIATGSALGAGISAGSIMPVLFGRLGKRLPRRLLNKIVLGRALAGAAAGGAAGGITAKEQPHVFHYNYHGTKGGGK